MQTMYPAQAFSPTTALAASITATDTTIPVVDLSKLPPAPNLVTIGEGPNAETVLYTGTDTNAGTLTGVTRGFQGAAKAWEAGTPIARLLTAYDHDAFKSNIEEVSQRITAHEEAADPHPQYAPDEHEHEMADVQGLQAALDNKASKSHTHTLAQITDAGTAAARNVEDFATPSSVEEVRGIAEAAQAAASTAQSAADGAASAAASAQSTADAAQAAITTHAARTDNPHGVTAAQLGAANILAQIKTVDGSGSGLDADTVDGEDAASLKANARALSTAKLIAEVKSSAPSSPVNGQIWYDAANHKFRGYANGAWV